MLALTALIGNAAVGDLVTKDHMVFKIITEPTTTEYGTVELMGFESNYHPEGLYLTYLYRLNDDLYRVSEIHSQAFRYEPYLRIVRIQHGVETIGQYAFANCSQLSTLYLPSSLTKIDTGAFINCPLLKGVYYSIYLNPPKAASGDVFDATMTRVYLHPHYINSVKEKLKINANFKYVTEYMTSSTIYDIYSWDGGYYFAKTFPSKVNKGQLMLVGFNTHSGGASAALGEYVYDSNDEMDLQFYELREIPSNILENNTDLKKVDLSKATNLNYIGNYAFRGCPNLTEVTTRLGGYIGQEAFANCPKLNKADIKCGNIHFRAFFNSPLAGGVTLREGIYEIQNQAFARETRSSSPTYTSITIPASAKTVHPYLAENTNCAEFIVNGNNPNYSSFNGLLYNKAYDYLSMCPPMGNPVKLHPLTRRINGKAFYGNPVIREINLPYGVTHVYSEAFAGSGLYYIKIPSSVQYLDSTAFNNCKNLSWTRCNLPASKVFTRPDGTSCFSSCPNMYLAMVPYECLDDYKAGKWSNTYNQPTFQNSPGDFKGSLIVKQTGPSTYTTASGFYDVVDNVGFSENGVNYAGKVRLAYHEIFNTVGPINLNVPEKVTSPDTDLIYKVVSVGQQVMGAHNSENGSVLEFTTTSVDTIAPNAFTGQKMLAKVNLGGDQPKVIGNTAFRNCSNLSELMIQGNEVTSGTNFYGSNAGDFKCYVKWDLVGNMINAVKSWKFVEFNSPEKGINAYYKDSNKVNAVSVNINTDWSNTGIDVYQCIGANPLKKIVNTKKTVIAAQDHGIIVANVVPDSIYKLGRPVKVLADPEIADFIEGNPVENTTFLNVAQVNSKLFKFNHDEVVFDDASASTELKAGTAFLRIPYSTKKELSMISGKWTLDFYDYSTQDDIRPGDITGNGIVDVDDMNVLIDAVLAGSTDNTYDVNGDGAVDVGDVNFLIDLILQNM